MPLHIDPPPTSLQSALDPRFAALQRIARFLKRLDRLLAKSNLSPSETMEAFEAARSVIAARCPEAIPSAINPVTGKEQPW